MLFYVLSELPLLKFHKHLLCECDQEHNSNADSVTVHTDHSLVQVCTPTRKLCLEVRLEHYKLRSHNYQQQDQNHVCMITASEQQQNKGTLKTSTFRLNMQKNQQQKTTAQPKIRKGEKKKKMKKKSAVTKTHLYICPFYTRRICTCKRENT